MQWSETMFRPAAKTLRQFAGLWLAVFSSLAVWQGLVKGQLDAGAILGAAALVVGVAGLARPAWVRWIFVVWMILAFPVGWTISRALLGFLFFGVFTPVALLLRLRGRDALGLRPPPAVDSYWTPKPTVTDPRRYFRQF
jgi:hypothetical protein